MSTSVCKTLPLLGAHIVTLFSFRGALPPVPPQIGDSSILVAKLKYRLANNDNYVVQLSTRRQRQNMIQGTNTETVASVRKFYSGHMLEWY